MSKFYSPSTRGFYATDIHGGSMPGDVVEISDEEHAALLQSEVEGKKIEHGANGHPVAVEPAPVTIAQLKAAKLAEINGKSQAFVDAVTAGYPQFEIETWPKQEAEARAWKADAAAKTPTIDRMAARRKIDRLEYLERTYQKTIAFELVYDVVGDRQRYVDIVTAIGVIDNATNRKKVSDVAVVFPAPQA